MNTQSILHFIVGVFTKSQLLLAVISSVGISILFFLVFLDALDALDSIVPLISQIFKLDGSYDSQDFFNLYLYGSLIFGIVAELLAITGIIRRKNKETTILQRLKKIGVILGIFSLGTFLSIFFVEYEGSYIKAFLVNLGFWIFAMISWWWYFLVQYLGNYLIKKMYAPYT